MCPLCVVALWASGQCSLCVDEELMVHKCTFSVEIWSLGPLVLLRKKKPSRCWCYYCGAVPLCEGISSCCIANQETDMTSSIKIIHLSINYLWANYHLVKTMSRLAVCQSGWTSRRLTTLCLSSPRLPSCSMCLSDPSTEPVNHPNISQPYRGSLGCCRVRNSGRKERSKRQTSWNNKRGICLFQYQTTEKWRKDDNSRICIDGIRSSLVIAIGDLIRRTSPLRQICNFWLYKINWIQNWLGWQMGPIHTIHSTVFLTDRVGKYDIVEKWPNTLLVSVFCVWKREMGTGEKQLQQIWLFLFALFKYLFPQPLVSAYFTMWTSARLESRVV